MSVLAAATIASSLLSAGASYIGGKKDRQAIKKANAANTPTAQVKAWEAAGINPIMGLTQAQYVPQQAALIGDSFANAGNALANGMNILHDDQVRETAVFKENEKLREALNDATKPRERSLLDRSGPLLQQSGTDRDESINQAYDPIPQGGPRVGPSLGDRNGFANVVEQQASVFAPDRDVERSPVEDTSLTMVVDNAFTRWAGRPMSVLGQDGEPLGIGELLSLGVQVGPQVAIQGFKDRDDSVAYRGIDAGLRGAAAVATNLYERDRALNSDPNRPPAIGTSDFWSDVGSVVVNSPPTLREEFRPDLSGGFSSLFFPQQ